MICCQYHIIRLNERGKCGVLVEEDLKNQVLFRKALRPNANWILYKFSIWYMIYVDMFQVCKPTISMLPPKSISDHNMFKKPLLYHWDLSWLRRFGGPMLRVVHLCACQRVPWHSEMIGEEVKGESRKCHGFEMFEPQHRSVFYNNIYIHTHLIMFTIVYHMYIILLIARKSWKSRQVSAQIRRIWFGIFSFFKYSWLVRTVTVLPKQCK